MRNLLICLDAVIPVFLTMLTGFCARKVGILTRKDVIKMNAVGFRVFLPAMLFWNIYSADLATLFDFKLVGFIVLCIFVNFGLGLLYVYYFVKDRRQKGVVLQGTFRSNYLITALPMARNLVGEGITALVGSLVSVIVPLFNVLSVLSMEMYSGEKIKPGRLAAGIIKNPLVDGFLAALVLLLLGIRLPAPAEAVVEDFASLASTYALFLLGAFIDLGSIRSGAGQIAAVSFLRLVFFPGLFLLAALLLGFRNEAFVALMGLFSSSVAVAAFTMSEQMGGDADLAGNIVVVTSALLPVTFFAWSFLFKNLGVY